MTVLYCGAAYLLTSAALIIGFCRLKRREARMWGRIPMAKHTPEPWRYPVNGSIFTPDQSGSRYGSVLLVNGTAMPSGNHPRSDEADANAARIVACVNACAGIPTKDVGDTLQILWRLAEQVAQDYPDAADWKDARSRLRTLAVQALQAVTV